MMNSNPSEFRSMPTKANASQSGRRRGPRGSLSVRSLSSEGPWHVVPWLLRLGQVSPIYARRSVSAKAATTAKPVETCHCMDIRAAATQKAEVPAARACVEASLAAAVFVVALVAFDAGAEVGAEVASWRSGASSGSTLPPLYWVSVEATLVAAGTAAAESAAATVWAAKANAIKEMQRMVKDVPARVE
eukprot:TRINITY_DN1946_c0_g1_i2.p1 TRINITY_DN1946_c0_g1~~TRINITY_DN1946_c0_g1_i2.p1  ORF type:complete len:189 (+),score=41.39 TRINITY_DN1946_c0_g1_i2:110-676(+)